MKQLDVAEYWENRFERGPELETVGFLSFGRAFNVWMYRVRRALFLKRMRAAFKRYGIDPQRAKVLDVGSGSGFYIDRWQELGIRSLTGYDLTEAAVHSLGQKYPDVTFRRVDIGAYDAAGEAGTYDVISCVDVLYHIVDDVKYRAAISNMARMLKPGGLFVFTENCLHRPAVRTAFQTNRPLSDIEEYVRDAGLTVASRAPVFVLMNAPVDSTNPLLRMYWEAVRILLGHVNALGVIAGALLYWPERILAGVLKEGPSTEMLICRRS